MIVFLIVLALLCFFGISFKTNHINYLDKSQTGSIKGIFALIIFFSHVRPYLDLGVTFLDSFYTKLLGLIGQLMVTMFFFYSGYGIFESYRKNGNYSNQFGKNRILKTLLHFDIAVFCYLLLAIILNTLSDYSWVDYVFCWIGWGSLGNSNWFIFVVLVLYIIILISMKIAKKNETHKDGTLLIITSISSMVFWMILFLVGKPDYWYNTLLCLPLGMIFSYFKKYFDSINQKTIYHIILLILSIGSFVGLYIINLFLSNSAVYSLCAIAFCVMIVLITSFIRIGNKVLHFLGNISFEIYIFQRIPMMVLQKIGITNKYLFTIIALFLTIVISKVFCIVYACIDKKWFYRKGG